MSTMLNNTATNTATATNQDIKEFLLSGAKVNFEHNGKEMVYTIEGVRGLEVSAQGYIIDKGDVKYPKEANDTVYIAARKGFNALNIAYKSLILLLNGFVPKGGYILRLKDEALGYRPDNLRLVSKFNQQQEISFDTLDKTGAAAIAVELEAPAEDEDKTVVDPATVYTTKTAVVEYVAEDGMAFETLEAAAIHQRNVTAAKEVAQVVLDYNKGLYGVAEKAYLRVMHYDTDKPYENFRDVMDNFKGVTERTAKEVVQFKKFKVGDSPKLAHMFSGKAYSKEIAEEAVGLLGTIEDLYKKLEHLSTMTA